MSNVKYVQFQMSKLENENGYDLHRDHPGGQQEGVYNARIFVKPGTDEVLISL